MPFSQPNRGQMMEALTSEAALNATINEGSSEMIQKLAKTSLPQRARGHIFDGIDISFIARDILKLPPTVIRASRHMNRSSDDDVAAEEEVAEKKSAEPLIFTPCANYKAFVRQQAKQRKQLPVLKLASSTIPVSYNAHLTTSFIPPRVQTANPNPVVPSSLLPLRTAPTPVISVDRLQHHINEVNRVMGKRHLAPVKKVKSAASLVTQFSYQRSNSINSGLQRQKSIMSSHGNHNGNQCNHNGSHGSMSNHSSRDCKPLRERPLIDFPVPSV